MRIAGAEPQVRIRRNSAFTIVEMLLAVAILGMVIIGIYATWTALIQASAAGRNAALRAQRARVAIEAIETALTTAQMFSANPKYYWFIAQTSGEDSGSLEFTARLPDSFPASGRFGNQVVRRVRFFTDANRNLIMAQAPLLVANEEDYEPHTLQLAQDVTLFMFEFWDEQKKEYVTEWARTNQLPRLVRVALGLGQSGNSAQAPQDLVTRTIAMPATAIQPQWQRVPMAPGGPGMMPGMPPGQPGRPAVPGQPGGVTMPGGIQPGFPANILR